MYKCWVYILYKYIKWYIIRFLNYVNITFYFYTKCIVYYTYDILYYDILYHFKIIYIYDYACVCGCVHKLHLFKNIKMNTNWIILIHIMVI